MAAEGNCRGEKGKGLGNCVPSFCLYLWIPKVSNVHRPIKNGTCEFHPRCAYKVLTVVLENNENPVILKFENSPKRKPIVQAKHCLHHSFIMGNCHISADLKECVLHLWEAGWSRSDLCSVLCVSQASLY
jgi:hypothetical protein